MRSNARLDAEHNVFTLSAPRSHRQDEFDTWVKGEVVSHLVGDFLGFAGIFSTDGPVWYHQRKLASHIFARANFRSQIQAAVLGDVGKLDTLCNNVVSEGARVNLPDIFHRFTLEAFVKMAFGVDLDILPEQHQGLEHTHAFATSFDYAQSYIERRPLSLIPMWAEVFTEDGRKYRQCARFVNEFSTKLIDERYAAVDGKIEGASAATKSGKDLLQLFLDSGVPREDLPSVILNFIIAGRDTTAQALSWFCWEMHQHPDVLERVRQEVWSVLGRQPQRELEFDDHKELPYTQAALYESIRLHPAVPLSRRRAARDTVLKPNYDEATIESAKLPSLPVKKGQAVQFSDYVIARTPEVWGPDCEEYKPERFLSDQGQFKQPSQYKYRVFSECRPRTCRRFSARDADFACHLVTDSGPRLCLGQTLATYEAMAVISRLFGNFELVWDSDIGSKPPTYLPA